MATRSDWVTGIFIAAHITIMCVSAQNSLSAEDKQELLDAHNMFRGMVSPPATNMLRMEWNDELASIAQTYAAQCRFEHNDQRNSQSPSYTFVGENIFVTSSQSADYTGAVRDWYNEVADYDYSTNGCSRVCGHYTQVVWATSDMVGCGVARCRMVSGFSEPNSLLLICNYGPAGNFDGQLPYQSGASCSACPADRSTCLQNLCSATEATSQPATTSEIPEGGSAELTSVPTTVGATTATPNPPTTSPITVTPSTTDTPPTTAAPPTTATPPSATTPPNTAAPPTIAIIATTVNTGTTATIATSEIPEGGSADIPEGGSTELTTTSPITVTPATTDTPSNTADPRTIATIATTATTGTTSTTANTATTGTTSTIATTATMGTTSTTANTASTATPPTTATTSPSSTPTTASTSSPSARPLPPQLIRLLLFSNLSQNPFARIILLRYLRRYRYRFRLRIG